MDFLLFFDTPMTPDELLFVAALVLFGCSLIIFCMVLVVLFAERQRYRKKEKELHREIGLMQEQTNRLFSALRDEIHNEVNRIKKS